MVGYLESLPAGSAPARLEALKTLNPGPGFDALSGETETLLAEEASR